MCIIYFGTVDNTFSFYIGCSDWHHEVFLLPRKDASLVPWDSLCPSDQTFLGHNVGQGAVCNLCVCCAHPSAFFSRRSSSTPPPLV